MDCTSSSCDPQKASLRKINYRGGQETRKNQLAHDRTADSGKQEEDSSEEEQESSNMEYMASSHCRVVGIQLSKPDL
jgi:hypothetical protein